MWLKWHLQRVTPLFRSHEWLTDFYWMKYKCFKPALSILCDLKSFLCKNQRTQNRMLPVKLSFLMCVLSYAQRTAALRAPPCRGFFRQEPWRGLPFPTPGALTDPGFEPVSPALAGRFVTTEPSGKPQYRFTIAYQCTTDFLVSNFSLSTVLERGHATECSNCLLL